MKDLSYWRADNSYLMSWQPFTSQVLSSLCSWLTSIVKAIKTLTKFLFIYPPLTGHFKLLWSWYRSRLLELNLANHCSASFKQKLPSSRVNNLDALLRNCLWWLLANYIKTNWKENNEFSYIVSANVSQPSQNLLQFDYQENT